MIDYDVLAAAPSSACDKDFFVLKHFLYVVELDWWDSI